MNAVQFDRVSRHYGEVKAVDDISFQIPAGEFFTLLGPSGSGKTTCLRMIAGFEYPSEGEIQLFGEPCSTVPPYDRNLNTVFQDYALFPNMDVRDNIGYGLMLKGVAKAERYRKVDEMLELVRLPGVGNRKPGQLSGGQRQRVAMGRAIVRQPKVFLFDEPLSNLDAALRVHMRAEISRLHKKFNHASAIYVTHDQTEAMAMADKIVLLRAGPDMAKYGSVAQIGTPMDLYHRPSNRFVAAFLGSPRMNFIEARVVGSDAAGLTLQIGAGEAVTVPVDASALKAGTTVTLGLRPEHMHPVAPGSAECRMTRAVRQVERFGEYSYVYLTSDSAEALIAKVPGDCYTPCGEAMSFGFDPAHCHAFDTEGLALAHLAAH